MKIQHGSGNYFLVIDLILKIGDNFNNIQYENANEFSDAMSYEYPGINFESVVHLYNKWLNTITTWVSTPGNDYKENWKFIHIFCSVVGSEVIVSMKQYIIESKIVEKEKELAELSNGLITKIVCYGWEVFNNPDKKLPKICYYTKNGDDSQTYDIYVYNDKVILTNSDRSKPSVLTGPYFLYNAGEKLKE